jgi:transcriptional regulator with XRE-family HTH domain
MAGRFKPRNTTDPWVNWLLARMTERGLTQSLLARQLGCTRKAIHQWTQPAGTLPAACKAELIASILGVGLDEVRRAMGAAWIARGKISFDAAAAHAATLPTGAA